MEFKLGTAYVAAREIDNAEHGLSILAMHKNEPSDILLVGKDSTGLPGIKAHKVILASASPHFRGAFESEGFTDSETEEYRVEEVDHESLRAIVDFVYKRALRISGENIRERLKLVLTGADYLLMPELFQLCAKRLDAPSYINVTCAVDMWLFARRYRCIALEESARRTIASNLRVVADKSDFLELDKKDVVPLLKGLVSASPNSVCEAAVAWLGYEEAERKADCDEIMRQVPLKAVSAQVLKRTAEVSFLSEHSLWTVNQVRAMRAEIDGLHMRIKRVISKR